MKTEIPSDVLKQARVLCAISDDPNASTYEIEEALRQAHKILAPYGLTVQEILESLRRDLVEEWYHVPGRQRRTNWISDLMDHISLFTDSNYIYRSGYVLEFGFIGLFSQVQRAIFHAETLHEQIEYYGEYRAPRHMRDIRIYKQGIVDRIAVTMRDLKSRKVSEAVVAPMVTTIQSTPEGSRLIVSIPAKAKEIANYRERGFIRARVDGETYMFDALPKLRPDMEIEVVIDRIIMRTDIEDRIKEDLETGLNLTGEVYVENIDTFDRQPFRVERLGPPPPPESVLMKLKLMIREHIDGLGSIPGSSTSRSWDAQNFNPDYNIGYQHGAEIKIRSR